MQDQNGIFPGYFIKQPLFQSISKLRRLLSEQDSCFHANQVSLSFLEDHINSNGLDNSKFIADLCKKFSISGGHRNWEVTKRLMSQSYVVQTYNMQEIFFKSFNAEYRAYKVVADWKFTYKEGSSTKNLDPYSQLIKSIPQAESEKFASTPESMAIQYYRLVRNGIVHSENGSMDKPTTFFKDHINPHLENFKGYYKFLVDDKVPAPNPPQHINHYDFTFYSRCLKNLANLINDSCKLSTHEILDFELTNQEFVGGMHRYNPMDDEAIKNKLKSELSNFFTFKYGNLPGEKQEFIDLYFEWYINNYS